jgi:hypothetical protein
MQQLIIFSTLAIMLTFQNCSDVKFQTGATGAGTAEEEQIHEIEAKCNAGPIQHLTKQINFPSNLNASSTVCQWDEDSNGDFVMEDSRVMARNEQTQSFQLPAGATLCEVSFNISNQTFEYDDMFFLNFNDVILVSAASFFNGFSQWQGLDTYDWSVFNRTYWPDNYNNNSHIYCAGQSQGLGSCTVPITETTGDFDLSFDKSLIQRIGMRGGSQHSFKLVVTGDNNPNVDCRHEALSFSIDASYVTN